MSVPDDVGGFTVAQLKRAAIQRFRDLQFEELSGSNDEVLEWGKTLKKALLSLQKVANEVAERHGVACVELDAMITRLNDIICELDYEELIDGYDYDI